MLAYEADWYKSNIGLITIDLLNVAHLISLFFNNAYFLMEKNNLCVALYARIQNNTLRYFRILF